MSFHFWGVLQNSKAKSQYFIQLNLISPPLPFEPSPAWRLLTEEFVVRAALTTLSGQSVLEPCHVGMATLRCFFAMSFLRLQTLNLDVLSAEHLSNGAQWSKNSFGDAILCKLSNNLHFCIWLNPFLLSLLCLCYSAPKGCCYILYQSHCHFWDA